MQSQVKAAYQTVRKEYLLPPTDTASAAPLPPSGVPPADYPSPSSTTASEGAELDTSSHLVEDSGNSARPMPPSKAGASKQGSGRAGGENDRPRADGVGQPSRKRRRQRSNSKGDIKVAGKPKRFLILRVDIAEAMFDTDSNAQMGWRRGRSARVAPRWVRTRQGVSGSDRGRGTRAVYDCNS